mgnify:CR=1 FL=1
MVRKRIESKSLQLGKEEKEIDLDAYYEACRIARYCDNLPPLKEDFVIKNKEKNNGFFNK